MPGSGVEPPDVSLREYIEQRLDGMERASAANVARLEQHHEDTVSALRRHVDASVERILSDRTAVIERMESERNLIVQDVERRLQSLNALREAVERDRELFMRKESFDLQHRELTQRMDRIEQSVIEVRASSSGSRYTIGIAIALVGIFSSLIAVVVHILVS